MLAHVYVVCLATTINFNVYITLEVAVLLIKLFNTATHVHVNTLN